MEFLQNPTEEEIAQLLAVRDEDDIAKEKSMGKACVVRLGHEFKDMSQRFEQRDRGHAQQYSGLYFFRLNKLRPSLRTAAFRKWGQNCCILDNIKDIKPKDQCVIIGTLYKDMKLKPSALAQYMNTLALESNAKSFVSPSDFLLLEDETARIRLISSGQEETSPMKSPPSVASSLAEGDNLNVQRLVTGIIIAVSGHRNESGEFVVSSWALPGVAPQSCVPRGPSDSLPSAEGPRYVAFVSGLEIGHANLGGMTSLKLLRDFLLGASAGDMAQQRLSSSIVRLVVAGNALSAAVTSKTTKAVKGGGASDAAADDIALLDEIDTFFAEIAASIPVDLMPGAEDPSAVFLPQQPLHPALFEHAKRFGTFRSTTNPYAFSVDGIRFLGSSGQPVQDVTLYSELTNPLDALEFTVQCRCLAPTAPDTLPCFPAVSQDPFCLSSEFSEEEKELFPHVVFSGNSSSPSWRYAKPPPLDKTAADSGSESNRGTLCVCVPKYSECPCLVLVSIPRCEASLVHFLA